jgi:hypothetical protein
LVWPSFQTAVDGWIGSKVLLHGPPATVLDRGAALDDEGDRGGPFVGGLLKGVSYERARCLRGVPLPERSPRIRLDCRIYLTRLEAQLLVVNDFET